MGRCHEASRLHRIRHSVRADDVRRDGVLASQMICATLVRRVRTATKTPIETKRPGCRPAAELLGVNFASGQIASTRIEIFSRFRAEKSFTDTFPLPLLAADVGRCAALGLDLQRCRGLLFLTPCT